MNKWLFHQIGLTRTSLSATFTRVSKFVEGNLCVVVVFVVFYIGKAPFPGAFSHALSNRLKCVNRNELSMFKALNKTFKQKCAVLLLNQVEGRLKSLKNQH